MTESDLLISKRGQLGVLQGEPLGALAGEAHLHAGVEPAALEVDDDAVAELGVAHVLPDPERLLVGTLHLEAGALRGLVAVGIGRRSAPAAGAPRPAPAAAEERALAAMLELLFGQHDPLAEIGRDLLDETRHDAVARLAVQHAAAGVRDVEALARARDRHVHEAALFLDAAVLEHAVLVGEESLLQPRDEDRGELEPLGGVDRHELQRVLSRSGFALARFQARVREERGENLLLRRAGNAGDVFLRFARGLEAALEVLAEPHPRVYQLLPVLAPAPPVLPAGIMCLAFPPTPDL